MAFRLLKLRLIFADIAQIVVHLRHIWFDIQRTLIAGDCLIELPRHLIGIAEIVLHQMRLRIYNRRIPLKILGH